MIITDRIVRELWNLQSKYKDYATSHTRVIHYDDEKQIRAAIDKILAEQGAQLAPIERCMEPAGQAMSPFHWFCCVLPKGHTGEHRKGGQCTAHGEYIGDQCPLWPECIKRITEAELRPTPAPAAPTPEDAEMYGDLCLHGAAYGECTHGCIAPSVSPEPERMVSIAAVEKAMRDAGCVDREVMHTIRNLTPQPPAKPTKQEPVRFLGFSGSMMVFSDSPLIVGNYKADKEKCDEQ